MPSISHHGLLLAPSGPTYTPITATGGTVTDVSIAGRLYRVHDFTTSGDFVVTSLGTNPEEAKALLVAGGGSGARNGGSGAGGEVKEWAPTLSANTFPIVIGAGGAAVTTGNTNGLQGSDSTAFGVNCDGGGYGGTFATPGGNAVDGGGGGYTTSGGNPAGGTGTRKGGDGFSGTVNVAAAAGGGAGAGTAGGNASSGQGGNGGDGFASSIDGTARYYGGGAGAYGPTPGAAGLGGVAGTASGAAANNGTDGLGNGGSAVITGTSGVASGKGGKGRCIVAYPLVAP